MSIFKRNPALTAVCIFLLLAALGLISNLVSGAENDRPVLSRSFLDYNRDSQNEELILEMSDGKHYTDDEPGPFMGENWEGSFTLKLAKPDGRIISELDLNRAFGDETMRFQRKFVIMFDDYNNDGDIDFSIGQYFSSNGNIYQLFSIDSEGGIKVLEIKGRNGIVTAERDYSVKYEKVDPGTFKNKYYDMTAGVYKDSSYSWSANDVIFIEETGLDEEYNRLLNPQSNGKEQRKEIVLEKYEEQIICKFDDKIVDDTGKIIGQNYIAEPSKKIEADPRYILRLPENTNKSREQVTGLFKPMLELIRHNDETGIVFSLENISDKDQVFYSGSSQKYDFYVFDNDGHEVYRWSHDKCFATVITETKLKKGERISFSELWDHTDNEGEKVPSGKYRIVVNIIARFEDGSKADPDELTATGCIEIP